MVRIFFVISGFALSVRPFQQMRQNQHQATLTRLSSAVLRRFPRLYLPVFAVTLAFAIAIWAGLFEPGRAAREAWPSEIQGLADAPARLSFTRQMRAWLAGNQEMIRTGSPHVWHGSTWTIPVEYNNSLSLFLVLLSLARLQFRIRILILGILLFICCCWAWPDQLNFYAGILISDVYLEFQGRARVQACPCHKMLHQYDGKDRLVYCMWHC